MTDTPEKLRATRPDTEKLAGDLRAVRAHHAFTRDHIGQPGCEVRKVAAEYVETLDRALSHIAALEETIAGEPGRVREAFTYAFASGYRYADETSRSCMSAMYDAWKEFSAIRNEGSGV